MEQVCLVELDFEQQVASQDLEYVPVTFSVNIRVHRGK